MNLYSVLRRLWLNKRITLGCAVLAIVVAIVVGFRISLSPPSLKPRALQLGVAGVQVLVDSRNSSLSQLSNNYANPLASLASTYTQLISSAQIVGKVAAAVGVAPQNIGVQEQLTQPVPLSASQSLEPQVGTQILATRKRYYIDARNDTGSQIISIFTQAPTGAIARKMAVTTAQAMIEYARAGVRSGHVPFGRAVVLRQVGGPYGKTLDRSVSFDAAVLVGVITWILALIAAFTLQTQARRERGTLGHRPLPEA